MTTRNRSLILGIILACFTISLAAAPAPHDLKVVLKQVNAPGGQILYPGPVKFDLVVTNRGPAPVKGSYKVLINKFDHTGQRWIKAVTTFDLPLLEPGKTFSRGFADRAGDARTDAGTTFIYRAAIGPGYYTDATNVDNKSDVGIRFLKSAQ